VRRARILSLGLMLVVSACGSGDAGGGADESSDPAGPGSTPAGGDASAPAESSGAGPGGGAVINPQPPGQASVSVDGVEYTFEGEILIVCSIGDGFNYTFSAEDGRVTLAAGGQDLGDAGWGGSINFTVNDEEPDPDSGELVFVKYVVFLPDVDGSTMAFDGNSMSFSGPMLKQTPGSDPPGEDVGTGTVSVTCP
jgi:hypothetical protein